MLYTHYVYLMQSCQIPTATFQIWYDGPPFTDKETEAQRSSVTKWQSPEFNPKCSNLCSFCHNNAPRFGVLLPLLFRAKAKAQFNTIKEWEMGLQKYNLLSKLPPACAQLWWMHTLRISHGTPGKALDPTFS